MCAFVQQHHLIGKTFAMRNAANEPDVIFFVACELTWRKSVRHCQKDYFTDMFGEDENVHPANIADEVFNFYHVLNDTYDELFPEAPAVSPPVKNLCFHARRLLLFCWKKAILSFQIFPEVQFHNRSHQRLYMRRWKLGYSIFKVSCFLQLCWTH